MKDACLPGTCAYEKHIRRRQEHVQLLKSSIFYLAVEAYCERHDILVPQPPDVYFGTVSWWRKQFSFFKQGYYDAYINVVLVYQPIDVCLDYARFLADDIDDVLLLHAACTKYRSA